MLEKVNGKTILKAPSVLISGGSGMVGKYLTSALLDRGYKVSHLSRNTNQFGIVRVYRWAPEEGILDPLHLEGVDFIVHLTGANLGEKPWTKQRKEEIIKSRVEPARLLHKVVRDSGINIK
jgi:NAD dependent epimerase/dehydratase family enzyme